ncbi:hypothetical protein [Azospirillum agricola]|uniref:hypothetical protein n=1 Tax=Azospirillum agricola TaxID=1720247 RepID=UPI000A0F11E7|nr:hypothetical protein [Azospirillum agricola]SMH62763.1 hypothetical protein SAMN02982994_6579 [Azospirillum lipoferum]
MAYKTDTVAALGRALRERLDRASRVGHDWRALQADDRGDLSLEAIPLILLGAGSVMARLFVRHALEHLTVIGVVDNVHAGTVQDGRTILDDAGLRELLRREPGAVEVMCCNSDDAVAHFQGVWCSSGRPLLSLFEAMRLVGQLDPGMMGTAAQIGGLLDREVPWRGFADADSHRCFLAVLLYRLTWDARWLDPVRRPYRDMYFFTDALSVGEDVYRRGVLTPIGTGAC